MNRLPKMARFLQRRPPALVVEQRDVLDQAGELVARQQARLGEGQPAGPEDEAVDEDQRDDQRRAQDEPGQRRLDVVAEGLAGPNEPGGLRRWSAVHTPPVVWRCGGERTRAGTGRPRPRPAGLAALAGDRHAFGGLLRRHAGVFMKAVTTSNIAPLLAGGIAISWAQLGTSVPLLAAALNSAAESLAH